MKCSIHWTTSDNDRFAVQLTKSKAPFTIINEGNTSQFVIEVNRSLLFWFGGHCRLDDEALELERKIRKEFDD